MARYAVTAWSAANAVGDSVTAIVDALGTHARPRGPRPGFIHPVAAMSLPESDADTRRAVRIAAAALGGVRSRIAAAMARWGASRVGLVVCASSRDDDLRRDAAREGAPVPASTPASLVEALGRQTGLRGPSFAVVDDRHGVGGWEAARALVRRDFVDAVLLGGVDVLGPAAPAEAGEAAAFVMVERSGDALIELYDDPPASETWREDIAYVDDGVDLRGHTGVLAGADLATSLAVAAEALSRGAHPRDGVELAGDHVVVRRGPADVVVHARLS